MDPIISAALSAGYTLLQALWNVKEVCQFKRDNDEVAKELSTFILNLDQDLLILKPKTARSNSAVWAAEALKEDLEKAGEYVQKCLKRGFFKSVWSVTTIHGKLKRIRQNLSTSFQAKLQVIIFDVMIEEQAKQEEFRANLLRVQKSLTDTFSDSVFAQEDLSNKMHDMSANILDLRSELRSLLQPVLDGLASLQAGEHRRDLESIISQVRGTEAQTAETEKFFADVLANLEGLRVRDCAGASLRVRRDEEIRDDHWMEDPLTCEIMCDPVKCTDGRTYDRWTIIDKNLVQSPFDHSLPEFSILVDDIDVRGRLFSQFPMQEELFRARRHRYRQAALQHVNDSEYGDAFTKLTRVLQWAREDEECKQKLEQLLEKLQVMEVEDEEAPTGTGDKGDITCQNAKGWFPMTFRVSWLAANKPCPQITRLPGASDSTPLPGYYFEVHSQISELYVSIGFKLEGHEPPFLYEYGSGGRSDSGLGYSVPRGQCTELWKCDPLANLADNESGMLTFPRRIVTQVMGAGINWASKEVFFTRNGELTWLLLGAPQLDSQMKLYPAFSLDWKGFSTPQLRGENFGQKPFSFAFEKMFDPTFRKGVTGRLVESKDSLGFLVQPRRSVGLT